MMSQWIQEITEGIPSTLPTGPTMDPNVPRAPRRENILTESEERLALANALRYFPATLHPELAPEFAEELRTYGRIYMYRYRPHHEMRARPIQSYPARSVQAAAIMHMIQNNLDPAVAQHPYELVTYGGNGVFQNWAQYRLTMQYLSEMKSKPWSCTPAIRSASFRHTLMPSVVRPTGWSSRTIRLRKTILMSALGVPSQTDRR